MARVGLTYPLAGQCPWVVHMSLVPRSPNLPRNAEILRSLDPSPVGARLVKTGQDGEFQ